MDYDFQSIEKKWQDVWEKEKYGLSEDFSNKEKYYHLVEFPYPSGSGLHVGHCMMHTAADAICRMQRMQGKNVLFPIGWDSFGLPTENYAIKTGILPQVATEQNIAIFKKQIKSLGYAFDWSREINTSDPSYYKWTQWIFLQFYRHAIVDGKLVSVADDDRETPRLAFQSEMAINWCPSCKIGLANEEVIAGKCERCEAGTERRMQKQWMLRITAYADRLIKDLDTVDYLKKIKTQQINWIGRSEGTNIRFKIKDSKLKITDLYIEVFTTRADTLFGCTYVVLAPENPLVAELKDSITNYDEVIQYIEHAAGKSDLERTELQKDKTGVELKGVKAVNPINGEEVSIWVADYVLASYGTGAVMAVPSHDERDFEFAKKYSIEIRDVIIPVEGEPHEGEEFRNTVSAIVHRKSDNKYLLVKWNGFNWVSLSIGGVEDGESPEDAVVREVLEETGYKVKPIERLGGVVESHFYAENKKVWRSRLDQPILCELVDDSPGSVSDEEKSKHEAIWMTVDEALRQITHPYNKIGIERYVKKNYAYTGYGKLVDSGFFTGMASEEAKKKITEKLNEMKSGSFAINYKLRDWVFSRQHYWGEPIPIIHCDKCGALPLSLDDLPLELPIVEKYQPTDTGESPLAVISDWVNITCYKCGGPAKRETDTMPNWAGSSWYFLRYTDPKNNEVFASKELLKYWMPVDLYDGGMEHTTLHLLYSRFWHKFLFDLKEVATSEPYSKRIAHGMILGTDGQKMSKSKGNVINPDEIVAEFGADTLRGYIMFIGPYDQESAWNTAGVQGVHRFLKRVWNNAGKVADTSDSEELLIKLNQTIEGVTADLLNFRFNTVISKLMEFNNLLDKVDSVSKESFGKYIELLHSPCPHIASELWEKIGNTQKIFESEWPVADSRYLKNPEITIVVQINGKVRDKIVSKNGISEEETKDLAMSATKVQEIIKGKEIKKIIVVPNKLVNIVI